MLRWSDIFIHIFWGINTFQYHIDLLYIYLHTQHNDCNVSPFNNTGLMCSENTTVKKGKEGEGVYLIRIVTE